MTKPPPHYWRQGDPLITVDTAWGPEDYPLCLTDGCGMPVTIATGSPMRWWGLGQGWSEWQCTRGHRYAYRPQGGVISHVSARI